MSDLRSVIKKHIATERTTLLREKNREYVFAVEKTATKHTIRVAVEKVFNVKVDEVRTLIVPGKIKRQGRRKDADLEKGNCSPEKRSGHCNL
jgi:large subunit ribosomal protein L23